MIKNKRQYFCMTKFMFSFKEKQKSFYPVFDKIMGSRKVFGNLTGIITYPEIKIKHKFLSSSEQLRIGIPKWKRI